MSPEISAALGMITVMLLLIIVMIPEAGCTCILNNEYITLSMV